MQEKLAEWMWMMFSQEQECDNERFYTLQDLEINDTSASLNINIVYTSFCMKILHLKVYFHSVGFTASHQSNIIVIVTITSLNATFLIPIT